MATTPQSDLEVRLRGRDELSPLLASLDSKIIRWVGAVSASLAAVKIGSAPILAAAALERELANVSKTTNFLPSQLKELSDALLVMSTRSDVATTDLAKIAAAAGQQGLGKDGVAGVVQFTESVARMASVLDVTADVAGASIGKIINIFKVPLKDIENVVSSFNEVANNSTATGDELLDVVKRIGDATGKLRLDEAVGLAATGLDFGISPEVVGSTFTAIFSKVDQKAEQFARLMTTAGLDLGRGMVTSTQDWIELIEKDGVKALNSVVTALRTLKPEDQQNAITKLIGAGRQGALVNKLVQDTSDAVMKKNLRNAQIGFDEGKSAIREQDTVMKTLVAQSQAAMNSLFKLGVDVTNQLLTPLTEYVSQLNLALQDKGLQSFLKSIANSVMSMVDGLVTAVKFVAALNVNWENFIAVGKAFVALKLGTLLGGYLSSGAGTFGDKLRYIATGQEAVTATTKASAAAQASADQQFKTSLASRLLGYEEMSRAAAAASAAKVAQAAAEQRADDAAIASAAAAAAARRPERIAAVATGRTAQASDAITTQKTAVSTALKAGQAAEAAAIVAHQAALQKKAAENSANLQAIERDYQAKRQIIRDTGTRVGLAALNRERDAAIAAETAGYAKRLAGVQGYHARKLTIDRAAAAADLALEQGKLAATLSAFDGANRKLLAASTVAGAAAGTAAAASGALTVANTALQTATANAGIASRAMNNFGIVYRTVAGVVATAGRLLMSGFLWVTVLYSIADALGLVDNLGAKFQWLTDKLGLTSKATRDAAVAREEETRKINEQAKAVDELVTKYEKLIDTRGAITDDGMTNVKGFMAEYTGAEDDRTRSAAIAKMVQFADAIKASGDQARNEIAANTGRLLDAERVKLARLQTDMADLQKTAESMPGISDAMGNTFGNAVTDAAPKLAEYAKGIEEARKRINDLGAASKAQQERLDELAASAAKVAENFAGMFTSDTLAAAKEQVPDFVALQEAMEAARQNMLKLKQEFEADKSNSDKEQAANLAKADFDRLSGAVGDSRKAILAFIEQQQSMPGISPFVFNSWETFKTLVTGTADILKKATNQALSAAAAGTPITGSAIPDKKPTPAKGTGSFNPKGDAKKNAASEAKKLRQAELDLERARIQAENSLKEEQSKQLLDIDSDLYERGLKSLSSYYADRKRIQLQANQFDIDDKNREIAAVNKELAEADTKSEKKKFEAQAVRLKGQVDVLVEQRKAIAYTNDEEERKAGENFLDQMRSEQNRLIADGILPPTAVGQFQDTLDELVASYRKTLTELGEGNPLGEAIIKGFKLQALSAVLAPMQRDYTNMLDDISRYQTRLSIAQSEGILTSNEAQAAYNKTLKGQIAPLASLLEKQQEQLRLNAALAGTNAYTDMQRQIDQTRITLEELNSQTDQFAKNFNKQTTETLGQILGSLEVSKAGIVEAVNSLLLTVLRSVQQALGTSIAEMVMRQLKQTGADGLGGWLQGVLQGGAGGVPEDAINAAAGAAGITLGTMANPMYVISADPSGLLGEASTGAFARMDRGQEKAEVPIEQVLNTAMDKVTTTVSGVMGQLTTNLSGLFDGFASILANLFSSLGNMFSGGGGGAGGFASLIAGLFHNGGKVGGNSGMRRNVHPALFSNAPRYHEGTLPGLKGNEVTAILQKGEHVLTERQQSDIANGAGATGGDAGTRVVNILDPDLARGFMESSAGEKIIINHIKANSSALGLKV